jgi:hypothetical protein
MVDFGNENEMLCLPLQKLLFIRTTDNFLTSSRNLTQSQDNFQQLFTFKCFNICAYSEARRG